MPFIRVTWVEGRTAAQKKELAQRITDAVLDVTGVSPEHVWILFEDGKRSDWAMEGQLLDQKS